MKATVGTAGFQAVLFVSKLLQNKSTHIARKCITELLGLSKELDNSSFENCYNIAKEIGTALE